MADKKPGLLKRIFSFGFGKKNKQAVEEEVPAIEEQIVEEAAAEPSAEALTAEAEAIKAKEQAAHDKAEKAEAARLEKEAAKAKAATEQEAAKAETAAQKEAAKAQAAKEKAEAKKQAEAEKAEKARLKKEAEALAAKKADAAKSAKEKAANEKARKEKKAAVDAKRKEEEEADKVAALKQEEAERQAAEEAAKIEEEQSVAEETRLAEQAELERLKAEAAEAQRLEELAEAESLAAQEAEAISESDPDLEEVFDDDEEDEPLEELEDEDDEDFDGSDDPDLEEISPAPVEPSSGEQTVTLTERKKPKEPEPEPEEEVQEEKRKVGWLKRLTKGLSRSSNALTENITKVFSDKKLDDDTLQELEDILIQADLGVETAMKITDALSAQKFGKTVTDEEVREIMAEEIEKILAPVAVDLDLDLEHQPHVILMIGVNGSGKTTTIGKLSQKLYDAGFSTSLIAGDTFRAAAIEQLTIWGDRTQSPVLSRPLGADSAGLAFDAWEMARDERRDVMLMDTAGRLQNRTELMAELEKIVRVLKKQDPSAPHTVLLTLDATTGQNALNQVEIFQEVAGVNGLVMTKLDGTARGGILVAIAAKYKLPVYFVGVGEQVEDLEPFEARDFARSIAGLPREE